MTREPSPEAKLAYKLALRAFALAATALGVAGTVATVCFLH